MRPLYLLWYHALTMLTQLNQFNTSLFSTRTKKEASQLLPLTLHRLRQSCKTIWPLSVTKRKLVSGNYEHSSLWQRLSICGTYPHDIHMCSNRRLYKNKGTMIKTKLYTIVLNIKLINWSINVALMATFQAFLYSFANIPCLAFYLFFNWNNGKMLIAQFHTENALQETKYIHIINS